MSEPPSMFDGDGYGDNENIDPQIFEELGGDISDFHDAMEHYAEGSGFTAEEWESFITEIRDVSYDDEGNLHFTFDFDMETDEGAYEGTRSM